MQTGKNSQTHRPAQSTHVERKQLSNIGLKQYLDVLNECEYVKKRVKILANIQNHQQNRVKNYKQSLDKFQKAKHEKQFEQNIKNDFLSKRKKLETQQRQLNQKLKDQRKNKISEALKQIQNERIRDRNIIRQQSQNIALKIIQNKQKERLQKKEKRNKVIQLQNSSKQNYRMFFVQKKADLAKRSQLQYSWFQQKKKEKSNQIQKLNQKQDNILDKSSQNMNQINSVKAKLAEIYGIQYRYCKNECKSLHRNLLQKSSGQNQNRKSKG